MKRLNRYMIDLLLVLGYFGLVGYLLWFISQ